MRTIKSVGKQWCHTTCCCEVDRSNALTRSCMSVNWEFRSFTWQKTRSPHRHKRKWNEKHWKMVQEMSFYFLPYFHFCHALSTQTDRQTDRQAGRQAGRHAGRQADKEQTKKERERERENRHRHQINKQTNKQTNTCRWRSSASVLGSLTRHR